MKVFIKQPGDVLDYDIVLTDWLEVADEIEFIEVTKPDGIDLANQGHTSDRIKLIIGGGTDGEEYKFTVLAHTESRVKEIDILIVVVDS